MTKPPKSKTTRKTKNVRSAATVDLLKIIFSDLYSPAQIATIKFNDRVDYGMDNEVLDLVTKIVKKFGKLPRDPISFEIFKLILLYICTPDVRRMVGDVKLLNFNQHHCLAVSKLEKIRREIHDYKFRERTPAEPHVAKLLDFIMKKNEPQHKYVEVVEFKKDACNLEGVIDKLCDAAPKREHSGDPGQLEHVVFVKRNTWPDRGYAISEDIYKMFPQLQEFFETDDGMEFYRFYMMYIVKQWPSVNCAILNHVNAFTNQYFKWMVGMLTFPNNLPLENRWKYAAMETPLGFPDPTKKMLLRVFEHLLNGKPKKICVFIHDIRVIMLKLKNLNVRFKSGGEPLMPEEDDKPLAHEFVRFSNVQSVMKFLEQLVSNIYDYVEITITPLHSLSLIDNKCIPIVSPYNTHCIPDTQAMERIAEILFNEVQIGRRLPLNFRCLEVLIRKMDDLFTGKEPFETMVDRATVQDLIQEASDLKGKQFNGTIKNTGENFASLSDGSSYNQKMTAFMNEYPQFKSLRPRVRDYQFPLPDNYTHLTPPGEIGVDLIKTLVWKEDEKKQ